MRAAVLYELGNGTLGAKLPSAIGRTAGGAGFDYVVEAVGRSETIRAAWAATRRGGTTVVVGAGGASDEVAFSVRRVGLDDVNNAFAAMQAGEVLRSVICC
jgi:S-(hydroxymethyl)glutathione dehydrogenase/alcohol dehydrogenase